jgi:hypothetical protein
MVLLGLFTLTSVSYAQGFDLAPGERLVAIDGVPVQSQVECSSGKCFPKLNATITDFRKNREVARDQRAYQHALREAQILADRQSVGHPLGVAPGCRYSGTGTSRSPDRPNHCYLNEISESRLVARAVVFKNGVYYWSAHYR